MNDSRAEIAVIGGSGFYALLDDIEKVIVDTPYGQPSCSVVIGTYEGRRIAFLPRHGKDHQYPPHLVPYRANLHALRTLGVSRIIGTCASGSLQPHIGPGTFVLCDQFVDRTWGRADTFFEGDQKREQFSGGTVAHIGVAEPYCAQLRRVAAHAGERMGFKVQKHGTIVVINGPRFSTKAESRWYSQQGWDVVNMTQYPEVPLARELGMCYAAIALITDFDAGLEGNPHIKPVNTDMVMKVFKQNNENVKALLFQIIKEIPSERQCLCKDGVKAAIIR